MNTFPRSRLEAFPRSRVAAEKQGHRYYFTDSACRKGHISARYTSTGNCVECSKNTNVTAYKKSGKDGLLASKGIKTRTVHIPDEYDEVLTGLVNSWMEEKFAKYPSLSVLVAPPVMPDSFKESIEDRRKRAWEAAAEYSNEEPLNHKVG